MSSIRLRWRQDGYWESFEVYKDTQPMNPAALPPPLVAGLTTLSYEDFNVDLNKSYYYRVMVRRPGGQMVSQQIIVETIDDSFNKDVELQFEGDFVDNISGTAWTNLSFAPVTFSDEIIGYQSSQSAKFPPNWSGIAANCPALNFNTGDFTLNVDSWLLNSNEGLFGTLHTVISGGTISDGNRSGIILNSSVNRVEFHIGGSAQLVTDNNVIAKSTWVNYKIIKHKDVLYLLVNDVIVKSRFHNTAINLNLLSAATMGASRLNQTGSYDHLYGGYLDNFYANSTTAHFPKIQRSPVVNIECKHGRISTGINTASVTLYNAAQFGTYQDRGSIKFLNTADYISVASSFLLTKAFRLDLDFWLLDVVGDKGLIFNNSDALRVIIGDDGHIQYNGVRVEGAIPVVGTWNKLSIQGSTLTLNGVTYPIAEINQPSSISSLYIGSPSGYNVKGIGYVSNITIWDFYNASAKMIDPRLKIDLPLNDSRASYLLKDKSGRRVWNPNGYGMIRTTEYKGVNCLYFNGSQRISTTGNLDLTFDRGFLLLEFRVCPELTTNTDIQAIISGATGNNLIYCVWNTTTNSFDLFMTICNRTVGTGIKIPANEWSLVTMRFVGSNLYVYVDRILQATYPALPMTNTAFDLATMYIGSSSTDTRWFTGYVADVKLVDGTHDITDLLDDTTTYEDRVLAYGPVAYWPITNTEVGPVTDMSVNKYDGTLIDTSKLTYGNKPIRNGHPGAMGFNVATTGTAQVQVSNHTKLQQLTVKSFSWCLWASRTTNTSFNYLFADFGNPLSGSSNMRSYQNVFEFSSDARQISWPNIQNNVPSFIAVVYDVEAQTYKAFVNGEWVSAAFPSPPGNASNGTTFHFPAFASWEYYGMRGYMSDLAFFDQALSDKAIEGIYLAGQFPDLIPPIARGEFVYISESGSFVDLAWDIDEEFEKYNIERSLEEFDNFTTIATDVLTTTYRDMTGIEAGRTYYYRVVGIKGAKQGVSTSVKISTYSRHILNFSELIQTDNNILNFERKV